MIRPCGLVALLITLLAGCGGSEAPPSGETSGAEAPGETVVTEKPSEGAEPREDENASRNAHALGEDASEAMHQAEWLREEQTRLERALEVHLGRHDISCGNAKETRDEVCLVTDRICALVEDDRAVEGRCEEAKGNCAKARDSVTVAGCKG